MTHGPSLSPRSLAPRGLVATLLALGLAAGASVAGAAQGEKVQRVPGHDRIVVVPDALEVEIWTNRGDGSSYCAGEEIEIYFRTSRDAYVAIYDRDTRGRVHRIFPNRYDGDHFVRGGRTYALPADGYHFEVTGPQGWETLEAIAARDLDDLRRATDDYLEGRLSRHGHDRGGYDDPGYDDPGDARRGRKWERSEPSFWEPDYASEPVRHPGERIAVVPDEVAIDRARHYVRDDRRCHAPRPRPRPPWRR